MTNGWTDIRNADVILAMGGNPAENHPVGFRFVMEARRNRNAKLVCVDPRFNRTAAGRRRFTFCRNRTGSIERSPLSIPLKRNETIQQQKMIKALIMLLLQKLSELFSPAGFPRFFGALPDAP